MSGKLLRPWWPTPLERRRLARLWLRGRRRPGGSRAIPVAWRPNTRLCFWWTLMTLWLDEPVWMSLAIIALPGWVWLCLIR